MTQPRRPSRLPLRARSRLWLRRLWLLGSGWVEKQKLRKMLEPLDFARRVWAEGPALRAVFVATLVLATAAAALLEWNRTGAPAAGWWLGTVSLALLVLAWSVAVAAAASLPAWGFALAVPWLFQFSVLTLQPVKVSPGMALPTWALVGLGWWLCRRDPRPGRGRVVWVVLAALGGVCTAGPSGFRQAFGLPMLVGMALMTLLLGSLGAAAWWATRHRTLPVPRFGPVLAGAVAVFGPLVALCAVRDRELLLSWVPGLFEYIDAIVVFYWVWTGGGFVLGLWKGVDWATQSALRLNLTHAAAWLLPLVTSLALALEWLVAYSGTVPADSFALALPNAAPALRLWAIHGVSNEAFEACRWHFWVTLAVLAFGGAQALRRRATPRFWIALCGAWITGWLAIRGYFEAQQGVVAAAEGLRLTGLFPFALLLLGPLVDVQTIEKDWRTVPSPRLRAQVGWMVLVCAIVIVAYISKGERAEVERKLFVMNGMIQVGLVRTVYGRLTRRAPRERCIALLDQALMGALGLGVGALLLCLPVPAPWHLPLGVLAVSAVLLAVRPWRRHWNQAAGAMGGAMLAAGATVYWLNPLPLNIPFLQLNDLLQRGPWFVPSSEWLLGLCATTATLGAFCGWFAFERRPVVA